MSQAVIADTGPLYATVDPTDQYHLRARQELQQLELEGSEITIVVSTVFETYSLILRKLSAHHARRWLRELELGSNIIVPTAQDYHRALPVVHRFPDQDITLFDALLLAVRDRLSLPIWTFDHHFDILGAPRWYPGV